MTPGPRLGAGSAAWSRRRLVRCLALMAFVKPAKAEGATVEIRQFAFSPAEIAVPVGGAVTFVNFDLVPHSATAQLFDTGALKKGERREIRFGAAGDFPYACRFHRHMTGIVHVA